MPLSLASVLHEIKKQDKWWDERVWRSTEVRFFKWIQQWKYEMGPWSRGGGGGGALHWNLIIWKIWPDRPSTTTKETRNRECKPRARGRTSSRTCRLIGIHGASRTYLTATPADKTHGETYARWRCQQPRAAPLFHLRFFFPPPTSSSSPRLLRRAAIRPATRLLLDIGTHNRSSRSSERMDWLFSWI